MAEHPVRDSEWRLWRWPVACVSLLLAGCSAVHGDFLHPQGPVAAEELHLLALTVLWMLVVVLPVLVLTPLVAWHYRRGNARATYRPQWEFSFWLEILVWGVPVLVVLALGALVWTQTRRLDPYRPIASRAAPLDVRVIGMDWKWLFIYPGQHVASVNELVIPAGRPVHLSMTSATVMQSLLLPSLAGQVYVMPGMRSELNLLATRTGTSFGENTQYNGRGLQDQHFAVRALTPAQFGDWVKGLRSNGQLLGQAQYARLERPSVLSRPEGFGAVEPGLFRAVIARSCPACAARLDEPVHTPSASSSAKEHHG
ncbi:ubiquinol oxidase subunit II [Thiomonas sp.]|uniref:ubiquinol oxidase subunit II n=1 Tax=Thiomonas sp. TaxID=2047785 RepID=UPI00261E6952|nr:ubiquinol oxidase subunit II [Thiomonas sp.]